MTATYQPIASTTLLSSAATVVFSGIPSSYTDIVFRISARTDHPGPQLSTSHIITINGDTATNYGVTYMYGYQATGLVAGVDNGVANINEAIANSDYTISGAYSTSEITLFGYSATQTTPIQIQTFVEDVVSSNLPANFVGSGLWDNTAPVTSVTFALSSTYVYLAGSSFYLYGIKNS